MVINGNHHRNKHNGVVEKMQLHTRHPELNHARRNRPVGVAIFSGLSELRKQRPPETISTPSSPRSPRVFPQISQRSLRARRFKSGSAPSASPVRSRAGMERGEGRGRQRRFQRRAPRDRRGSSRKFLGVLCALGVSNGRSAPSASPARSRAGTGRGGAPRPPETISNAELAEIAEGLPEHFSAFSARSAFHIGLRALCFPRALQSRHRARGRQGRQFI
jgi:hypothetical protein